MKKCPVCRVEKALEEFTVDRHRPSGRAPYCRPCKSAKDRARYTPRQRYEYERRYQLKKRYGTTWEALTALYGKACNICGSPGRTEFKCPLHVDHDHTTGLVRGLLCGSCNRGLGSFKDDKQLVVKAVDYLSKTQ
jgi:hypothetical protein